MKQKDIVTIIGAVIISAIISVFVSGKVFAPPKQRAQQVEVVPSISSDFPVPDATYFNNQSIDPTQLIKIGVPGSPTPFNSSP